MGRKKNKQRRAYLKKFSSDYINVTEKPRFLILDDTKPSEENNKVTSAGLERWLDNYGRVRQVVGPKHDKQVILNNSWMKEIPKTKGHMTGTIGNLTPKQKTEITLDILKNTPTIDRLKRYWTSTWKSGVEEYYVMRVLLNHGQWIDKLLACGSKYIIVSQVKNEVKFSYPFRSKEEAINAYEGRGRKIYWEGSFTLD